ncbi:MAG: FtsQ-type POTRA domain-containing protein, partial [Oscillospiraceae bacterium]
MALKKRNSRNKAIKKRKSGRYTLHYILLLVLMSCIALILSFTVFFSVEWIEVSEIQQYTKEDIILKSEIKQGDNLLRLNKSYHEQKIQERFPYIEKATIKKIYPIGLKIDITIAQPYASVKTKDSYILISESGKIIETDIKIKPEGILEIRGINIIQSEEGFNYLENSEEELKVLTTFIETSEKTELTNYNWIDL